MRVSAFVQHCTALGGCKIGGCWLSQFGPVHCHCCWATVVRLVVVAAVNILCMRKMCVWQAQGTRLQKVHRQNITISKTHIAIGVCLWAMGVKLRKLLYACNGHGRGIIIWAAVREDSAHRVCTLHLYACTLPLMVKCKWMNSIFCVARAFGSFFIHLDNHTNRVSSFC